MYVCVNINVFKNEFSTERMDGNAKKERHFQWPKFSVLTNFEEKIEKLFTIAKVHFGRIFHDEGEQ